MKRIMLIAGLIGMLLFVKGEALGGYGSSLSLEKGRALSLTVLQSELEECIGKDNCSGEILNLTGLTRISGFVVDGVNCDVILIGTVDSNLPPLYLEDFVVALRNTWLKYATLRNNVYYYSNPGCSIDPSPNVIQRLQSIGQKIISTPSRNTVEKNIESWEKTCRSPQQVRVLGIPFDCRFASILVKADYDMKGLVDGSDVISIPGFTSLSDMYIEEAERRFIQGEPVSVPLFMNRFWFYPGEMSYIEDKGIILIERCQVILLTSEEYLTGRGEIVESEYPNPLAQRFVESFTARYSEIAERRPIYAELENLFRYVSLVKILKFKTVDEESWIDLGFLLDSYSVAKTPVSQQLSGRAHVKDVEFLREIDDGSQIAQLWLPSCGGVDIDVAIGPENIEKDAASGLSKIRANILGSRPSTTVLFWEFSLERDQTLSPGKTKREPFPRGLPR